MAVPFLLLLISLAGVVAAFAGWPDLLLLAGPSAVASLILLLVAALRRRPEPPPVRNWVMVDGSNVMHWKDGKPQIETLSEVLAHLIGRGFTPAVVFDANAGYLVSGRYQDDFALSRQLGLPESRVLVVPKGTQADVVILSTARDLGARIVTNDRYRDWAEQHPEVREPGRLIRGGYRDGSLWLNLAQQAA